MTRSFCGRLAGIAVFGALSFGAVAAADRPSIAQQVTVKCWREYCVTDPQTGKEMCAKEEIKCPEQQ